MKIVHPMLSAPIVISEDFIAELIIENQKAFSEFLFDLQAQLTGEDGETVLSKDGVPLSIAKRLQLLIDFLNLEYNQRKVLNRLYMILSEAAMEGEWFLKSQEIISQINAYLKDLLADSPYPLVYIEEIDVPALFKLADVRLDYFSGSLGDTLVDFLTVMREFCGTECFVLVNLKAWLSDSELDSFYKAVLYRKISVLMVENAARPEAHPLERRRIIDRDLCEI